MGESSAKETDTEGEATDGGARSGEEDRWKRKESFESNCSELEGVDPQSDRIRLRKKKRLVEFNL